MRVDERLEECNEDINALNARIQNEFQNRESAEYNVNKRKNHGKVHPIIVDVFQAIRDEHIHDLNGHLSPIGDKAIAKRINSIAKRI